MGTPVQYGRWSTDPVCGVGGNTIWTVAQCPVCKVGGKCIGRRLTTWALIDLMERDRSDWPLVPLKVCSNRMTTTSTSRLIIIQGNDFWQWPTSVLFIPWEHPQRNTTRVNEYFTKNMQYSNKAKQSIVKTFVHSRAYYLLFALKILFSAVVTNLSCFLNFVRPSFTSEISKKHNWTYPLCLISHKWRKRGCIWKWGRTKYYFFHLLLRFQVTHNDVTPRAPSVFTSSQRVPLVIFTFFYIFSRISDIEMQRDSLPKHTNMKNDGSFRSFQSTQLCFSLGIWILASFYLTIIHRNLFDKLRDFGLPLSHSTSTADSFLPKGQTQFRWPSIVVLGFTFNKFGYYENSALLAHFFADWNKYQNSSVTNKNNEHIFS